MVRPVDFEIRDLPRAMTDQLSADLASLRIDRDVDPDARNPWRTLLLGCFVLLLGGAGIAFGYPAIEARLFKTEVAITEIALVSPSQSAVQLTATGYVMPQVLSKVSPRIAGRIEQVAVHQGDRVKAGALLFKLDDVDQKSATAAARAKVLAARARVETARANLGEADVQASRARTLARRGVGPEATAVDLEARMRSLAAAMRAAEAEVRAAEAEVETLALNLHHMAILAPIDGVVISKPAEVGEYVSPAAPIVELADFASLMVETDVSEARLGQVKQNAPCEIVLDAFPGIRRRGRVAEIMPRVNRAKATVVVKVRFSDLVSGVLPDMAARVSFLTQELDERAVKEAPRLLLPGLALAERAGAKVIFVVNNNDDRVRLTPITLGPKLGDGFELLEGPGAGTKVVKSPPVTLFDGKRIKERID